jgi:hypothetical protein
VILIDQEKVERERAKMAHLVIGQEVMVLVSGQAQTGWVEAKGFDAMFGDAASVKVRCSDGQTRWRMPSSIWPQA